MANRWLRTGVPILAGWAAMGWLLCTPGSTSAGIIQITDPGGEYTNVTTRIAIPGPPGSSVTSIANSTITISFTPSMVVREVTPGLPDGNGWATWGSPPQTETVLPGNLLYTGQAAGPLTTVTLSFNNPVSAFGVEIEPAVFDAFDITAEFFSGATSLGTITRTVDGLGDPLNPVFGSGGALLFAGTISDGDPLITSVVLSAPEGVVGPIGGDVGPNGFALAQLRYSPVRLAVEGGEVVGVAEVPEPGSLALVGLGIAGLMASRLRRRGEKPGPG